MAVELFVGDKVGVLDVSAALVKGDFGGFDTAIFDLVDGFIIFFGVSGNRDSEGTFPVTDLVLAEGAFCVVLAEIAFCVVLATWAVVFVGSRVEVGVVGVGCHGVSFPVQFLPLAEIFIPSGHRHV